MRHALPGTLALLLSLATSAQAAQNLLPNPTLRGFQRTGLYQLTVDGQIDGRAEIYVNEELPAYLVLPSTLFPVLLDPRTGMVETVTPAKVVRQPDGSLDLLADAALAPPGAFRIDGSRALFSAEGRPLILAPNPPLLGLKTNADLKAYGPEYLRNERAYRPDPAALQALRKTSREVTVRTFFGSWSPHSRLYVPEILKLEDQLGACKISFDYYGVPHDFQDPEVQRLNLQFLPLAIVFAGDRQIGTIEPCDWGAPEAKLAELLAASVSP